MAEVLITLGIIGVVAAMTLPTLIQKNEERVTVTKVKKFYSVINQALLMAIKDNGYVDEWNFLSEKEEDEDFGKADKLAVYLKPYLKISKDCGSESGCIAPQNYKLFNGTLWNSYDQSTQYYKMILADGSYLWLRTSGTNCTVTDGGYQNVCGLIWLDINGKNSPNVIGKDVFSFVLLKNRVMPHKGDEASDSGWNYASYILQHGDMKYLYK